MTPDELLLAIHGQFRADAARLLVVEPRLVPRVFLRLAETLHHHHHAEEAMLFPFVLRQTGVAPEDLVADHQVLTAAIAEVAACLDGAIDPLRAALSRFHGILVEHLDREEALVLPVLRELPAHEVWAQIHG